MSGSILESYTYYTAGVNLAGNGTNPFHIHFSGAAGQVFTLPPLHGQSFLQNKCYQFVFSVDQFLQME